VKTKRSNKIRVEIFSNAYFSLTVFWEKNLIVQTQLNLPCLSQTSYLEPYSKIIEQNIRIYGQKQTVYWPNPPLDLSRLSPFSQEVLQTLFKKVPFGQTITYGQLAHLVGKPKGARAIGQVMKNNPFPLIFPCHRVVKTTGVGQFSPLPQLKTILLQLEGVFKT